MKSQIVLSFAALAIFAGTLSTARAQSTGSEPKAIFKALDTNGDGTISATEVGKERERFFKRLVRVGDANKDGQLSRDEFLAAVNRSVPEVRAGSSRFGGNRQRGRFGQRRPNGGAFFDRLDTNRDGKLKLAELPQFLQGRFKPIFERLGKTELTREEFARASGNGFGGSRNAGAAMLRRLDKNRNGAIDKDEAQGRLKENFDRIDANKNGKLEAAELSRIQGDRQPGRKRPGQRKRPKQ